MTKSEAKELFGDVAKLCRALQIERATFYRWSDPLPIQKADQVRGAYHRVTEERDRLAISVFQPVDYVKDQ